MSPNKLLQIEQVTSGMSLSDDVLGMHGEVLLLRGTELTEGIISSLKRHSVEQISVVAAAQNDQDKAIFLKAKLLRLDHLFRFTGHLAINQQLKSYVVRYWMEKKHE